MRNFLTLSLSFVVAIVQAGGYRVSLQGVRQAALGAQGVAMNHDASVAFFNPAALAFVENQLSLVVGGFAVGINAKYQNLQTLQSAETNNPIGTPLYLAASYKPNDNLALGMSVTTPFGSTIDWGNQWVGRYVIDKIALKSVFIQPTVAYRVLPWLSVGGGFIFARGNVNIKRALAIGSQEGGIEIDKKGAYGNGYNLGIFMQPTKNLNIGVAYRSKITMKAEQGEIHFKNIPNLVKNNLPFSAKFFDAKLPLPAEMLIGVNYKITPSLMIGAEIGAVQWNAYKHLNLSLYEKQAYRNEEKVYLSNSTKNYANTLNYSIGAEYLPLENLALRAGYKFDKSPSPANYFNPETPTVDYHAFTAGLGFTIQQFTIDAMGEYVYGEQRRFDNVQYNFSGDILSRGFVFGLGLSYHIEKF